LVFNHAAADETKLKMPSNVTVRTAHALAFRSVGYVYESRLASSPWAWFPYLKEKMPRALDFVMRTGRDATSAGAVIMRRVYDRGGAVADTHLQPLQPTARRGVADVQLPAPFDCMVVAVVSTLPSSIAGGSTQRPCILAVSIKNVSCSAGVSLAS
jgi:hypothetical protein